MRIYLSSTFADLKPYREAVLGTIRRMGHEPFAMEDYGAEDRRPADKCVADVASAELYIGLFAWRYGFIPQGCQFSITEMEYRAAKEHGLPTLIFLLDSDVPWPPSSIDRGDNGSKIEHLREELMKTQLVDMFKSPEDLAAKVATALSKTVAASVAAQKSSPLVSSNPAWTLDNLREHAHKTSEDYLDKMRRERVYLPSIYTPRTEIEGHLASFVEPRCKKTGMLIVGPSGIGKTNTLCNVVDKWLHEPASSGDIILLLGGSTLPGGRFDLRNLLLDRLEIADNFSSFVSAFSTLRGVGNNQFILIIDSVDKHPQPVELLQQIDDLIVRVEDVPWLKIILSIGEIAYTANRKAGFIPAIREYYTTTRTDAGVEHESAEIFLGPLTDVELPIAYDKYRAAPGFTSSSAFDSLTLDVKTTLRNPLFMRIAMEIYNGRRMPRRILTTEVLLEYCSKKIFSDPNRAFFINRLVDLLFDNRLTVAAYDLITKDPDLRTLVLDMSPQSCYMQLLDEQVLEEQAKRISAILPPQRAIAFTYDRLLEYLLLTRLVERFGMAPDALTKLSNDAISYLPLYGALSAWILSRLEEGNFKEVASILHDGNNEVMRGIAHKLILELEQRLPTNIDTPSAALVDSPVGHFITAMLARPAVWTLEGLIECADELQRLGYLCRSSYIYEALSPFINVDTEPKIAISYHHCVGKVKSLMGMEAAALAEFESALAICCASGDKNGQQAMLDAMGSVYLGLGDFKRAKERLEDSLRIDRQLVAETGNPHAREGEAKSLFHLTTFYMKNGESEKAMENAEAALHIRKELGDKRNLAESFGQIALCYKRKGMIEEAIIYAKQSLSTYRELGSKIGIATSLASLGIVYRAMGKWDEAIDYLQEALDISKEIGRPGQVALALNSMGETYRWSGEYEAARKSYEMALELYQKLGQKSGIEMCLLNLGSTHLFNGNPTTAIDYLHQAQVLQKELYNVQGDPECLSYLSAAALETGFTTEALSYSDLALKILETKHFSEEDNQLVYYYRYRILQKLGKMTEADSALQAAYNDLNQQMEAIPSKEVRKRFSEAMPIRKSIMTEWEKRQALRG